jgi:hypothetical protein
MASEVTDQRDFKRSIVCDGFNAIDSKNFKQKNYIEEL